MKMALVQLLRRDENARKIFGKKELRIIEKQLWGMKLTQSERNRLSRDIRKKLEFISEIAKFEREFNLKKGARVRELIDKAEVVILGSKWGRKVKRIVLFGSFVDNEQNLSSDIDIAVVFDKISKKEATRFRADVLGEFDLNMDIQVYNVLPVKIRREIDKKGEVLYDK